MGSLLIRQLDDQTKARLRVRASTRGHSMEQEAREILKAALAVPRAKSMNAADAIRRHILPLGGVELKIPEREPLPRAVVLDR